MTPALSPNTQAILLLTAPLLAGRKSSSPELLTPGEYKRLARHLREIHHQPADLVLSEAGALLCACRPLFDEARLQRLLERGFLLSQAIERWQARAIWVISRADPDYPRRLKARLQEDAPAVLYGCGDIRLLETGGLAVVGSRHVDEALIEYTLSIGQLTARSGKTLVSGGARGIDRAAMQGALEVGGNACGVLADSLEKTAVNREHRNLLLDGQLVLISPYDPDVGFNVGNAMQRNKLIYAFADAALVVDSDVGKGGTWAGALEQLDKFKFVSVYVRSTGKPSVGLDALRKKGALAWPNPDDADAFEALLSTPSPSVNTSEQSELMLIAKNPKPAIAIPPENTPAAATESDSLLAQALCEASSDVTSPQSAQQDVETAAEARFSAAREPIQKLLIVPMKDAEVAAALKVSTAQAKSWLQRLVDEGALEKQKRPVLYVVKQKQLFV